MDQRFFPGVGNYIKSEALYATKLHPEKQWRKLSSKKLKELLLTTKDIMQSSYFSGGAELKDFKNLFTHQNLNLKCMAKKKMNMEMRLQVVLPLTKERVGIAQKFKNEILCPLYI